ncbi:PCRF domain-containing protein, partial [uncultured Dysosmobacter sp.]
MLDKLKDLDLRYEDLESQLGDPRVYGDAEKLRQVNRELKELLPVVETYRAYQAADSRRREAEELLHDPEMKEMAQDELAEAKEELEQLKEKLTILLLPRDPNDSRNVILEIRGGVGGEESALFAHSLLRMYTMYAESHGWKLEIASINETELGGVKDCSAVIEGDGAWSRLKFESGVHRVQRVPETESGGRIHTSA